MYKLFGTINPARTPLNVARYLARKMQCDTSNRPVEIVSGGREPRWAGDHCHYTTRSGERITYPSAYSKCGWSNMLYQYSTLRIEVGADWLRWAAAYLPPRWQQQLRAELQEVAS